MMRRVLSVAVLLAACVPRAAPAQGTVAAGASERAADLCVHPSWQRRCRSFFVTDFVPMIRVTPDAAFTPSTNVGWMYNLSGRSAVGVTGYLMMAFEDDPTIWMGFDARYRRWLGPQRSVGASIGVRLIELSEGVSEGTPTATIDWTPAKYVGLTVRVEPLHVTEMQGCYFGGGFGPPTGNFCTKPRKTEWATYVGGRLQGVPGSIASVIAVSVIFGLIVASAGN
jgi:hypothetical protein